MNWLRKRKPNKKLKTSFKSKYICKKKFIDLLIMHMYYNVNYYVSQNGNILSKIVIKTENKYLFKFEIKS